VAADVTETTFRSASPEDLPEIAEIFLTSRAGAFPEMPALVHTDDEVKAFVGSWDLTAPHRELWVAETAGRLLGFAEVKGDWLDDLYVRPDATGRGIGSSLLDVAKSLRPDGFCLWVFETNTRARAFYERRGLIVLERTDGSGNQEQAPDLRMAWPGADPMAFFRGLIDEVDADLAGLLGRRLALTRAVQRLKAVTGNTARDPNRESEIAATMARIAPELGYNRLARIVDTIISESLDAARR
jgi:chorismate mutase/GNAT superfamily N-acetyltransferase